MADEQVRLAQWFINTSYANRVDGIPYVEEDGITGWATMYALTRCLQHELGITSLSDNFGPATLGALESKYPRISARTELSDNFYRIIQSALYCKGYDGGNIDGSYNDRVSAAVELLKQDMGVLHAYPGDSLTPKVFKGLLNMDPYVVVSGGETAVREIQQFLNRWYVDRRDFFVIPCDGHHSRDVAKAMLLAIQYELGMADGVANGVFGPGTRAGLKEHTVAAGSPGRWVRLFQAAMLLNRRPASFNGIFTAQTEEAVAAFQSFTKLPQTGKGDYQTWASLLVSTGDPTRKGTALDCVSTITPARARTLTDAGYRYAGRYLSNVPGTSLDKEIKAGELATIAGAGMRCFPIYQTYGGEAGYFRNSQGSADAYAAIERAVHHGFKPGTRIYFAVDFDALDHQVSSHIIPHFEAVNRVLHADGRYEVGAYGPRNVCSRLAAARLSTASFVSDMSTGFSGNLGYPLPGDWAFDQIATLTVGSGDGAIEIDNNIASGRDIGQNSFAPRPVSQGPDVPFDMSRKGALLADIQVYLPTEGVPESGGGAAGIIQPNTTTESLDMVLEHDAAITDVARSLQIRKAMIMCPLLWEVRKWNHLDEKADDGVISYHTWGDYPGDPFVKSDSSTGLGQIFAATAIKARNHLIDRGRLNASRLDPESDSDLWSVWQKLHHDDAYNIRHVAYALMHAGHLKGVGLPSFLYPDSSTRLCFERYRGLGDDAVRDGHTQLGLYRIFEKHFAPLR